jgi:EAL domain-containing protein (putative c-di-GMP-specific phosphodiesterase class I)/GGDEF domain-containing protein
MQGVREEIGPQETTGAGAELAQILQHRRLVAFFQPVLGMAAGEILGFEGLIRGPEGSALRNPVPMFEAAHRNGLAAELENLCRQVVAETFMHRQLPGKLFLNISPDVLAQADYRSEDSLGQLEKLGLPPGRVVIELTENQPTHDFNLMREALFHYRGLGFEVAIDDLGEGFASLRLWSELHPEFVKIDKHFIRNINQDPLKLQFVKGIQQISDASGARVIAEGIETEAEFRVVRDLGISMAQGYFIAVPAAEPVRTPPPQVRAAMDARLIAVYPDAGVRNPRIATAQKLLMEVAAEPANATNEQVFNRFEAEPELHAIPVVDHGVPIGLINRHSFFDRYARPFQKELFGKRACTLFMDSAPLVVDQTISLQSLSLTVAESARRYLSDGFIIVDRGKYAGLGTGHDLIREITQMQIAAARYANPLTLLPGNVPISEHMERLVQAGSAFVACYCDLDNFKPFNDAFGYRRGDDLIQLTARVLLRAADAEADFVGHIGGDDFMMLMQSADWAERCQQALAAFDAEAPSLFTEEHRQAGGFHGEDRQGNRLFFPLAALSIGAVPVHPGDNASPLEISAAAAEAKKQAKRKPGSLLFVERRKCIGEPARA